MGQNDEALTVMIRDVVNCARCGGNHSGLEFSPFLMPPRETNASHWATCPKLGSPILLAVEYHVDWTPCAPKA